MHELLLLVAFKGLVIIWREMEAGIAEGDFWLEVREREKKRFVDGIWIDEGKRAWEKW